MTDEFFALMERYIRLGSLLPPDDVDHIDPAAVPDIKMILAEMNETKAQMDALMANYASIPHIKDSTRRVKKRS
ncbi:hypothetical protein [Bradyrhizobium sp. CCBAU 53380]|uniref:hypothetical protein n=1 Tax=Bradyrhizobium sp. CCBAU 53380 TaxID=1325117 RepID=UPI0023046DF5|nr:hypothetical protein [Bradyrhizobium sp. CCBAU 53380]MDA9424020.1 hypothetical protein [Bradyrhizobium sp. CCBAU 53380]